MRCPSCGYVTFEHLLACKRCGKPLPQPSGRRPPPPRPIAPSTGSSLQGNMPAADAGAAVGLAEPTDLGTPRGRSHQIAPPLPGATERPATAASPPKAGFWIRGLAFLVDVMLVSLLVWIGGVLVQGSVSLGGTVSSASEAALEWLESSAGILLALLIEAAYFTLSVGHSGQTPGKSLLRLKVIRVNGEAVGFGLAFVRWLAQGISFLALGAGVLMIAFTRYKQGLHDKIAGTLVVRLPR
jgi:uncharacterized RDD family membrane protein YckC